jgi:hypothetical protein
MTTVTTGRKTIHEACIDLAIDPSAFRLTLKAAVELAEAKKNLRDCLSADFDSLRAEGLTELEERVLKECLSYTIA